MSEKSTSCSEITISALSSALRRLPKVNVAKLLAEMNAEKPAILTSMQTRLVVAHLNRTLRDYGLTPITAQDIAGARFKPTLSGCLDPTKGLTIRALLTLVGARVGTGVTAVA